MITARRFVLIVLVCASLSCAAGIGRTVTVFRDSPRRGLTEKTDGGAEPTPVAFLDDKSKKKNSKKNKEKETPASPPEKSKNKNKDKKKGTEAPVETPKAPAKAPAKAPVVTPAKAPAKAPVVTPAKAPAKGPAVTPATAPVVAAPDANATANTGTTITADSSGRKVFDVTQFGAVVNDDQKDNAQAFIKTWVAACKNSAEPAKILVPAGSFLVGPVVFQGPCKSTKPIMIEVVGTIKGSTDISDYPSPEWFDIEMVQGIIITGKGTFDGQGPKVWHYNDCKTNPDCQKLPASIKFSRCGNGLVEGITSLNAKWFHIFAYDSKNFTFRDIKIIAPDESPNTDGIHLSSTTSVSISNTKIGTGDDCIAIASDNHDVTITGVTCGPGHGISVGSLGKWPDDKGVTNIHVNNCTFDNTTNGARIKTWGGTTSGEASGITYDNLIMKNVKNPIIIDQNYGRQNQASKWKLDNIHFRNIKGTSSSKVSVSLGCSSQFPCQGVELANIDLTYGGDKFQPGSKTDSVCENAKIIESGTLNPKPCSSPGKPISQN